MKVPLEDLEEMGFEIHVFHSLGQFGQLGRCHVKGQGISALVAFATWSVAHGDDLPAKVLTLLKQNEGILWSYWATLNP